MEEALTLNGSGAGTSITTAACLIAGALFMASSLSSLYAISAARSVQKSYNFYLTESLNWIGFALASVLLCYAALDIPLVLHEWRLARCGCPTQGASPV